MTRRWLCSIGDRMRSRTAARGLFRRLRTMLAPAGVREDGSSGHEAVTVFRQEPSSSSGPGILLLTEYAPVNIKDVQGVYQRLGLHVEALAKVGELHCAFLWPGQNPYTCEQLAQWGKAIRQAWPRVHTIAFIPTGTRRKVIDWFRDAIWAFRGAIGFYSGPTTSTCGRKETAAVMSVIGDLRPDLIFAHRLGAVAPLFRAGLTTIPIIFDMDDIEHVKLARYRTSGTGALNCGVRWLARRAGRRLSEAASYTLVCSDSDKKELERISQSAKIAVVPNSSYVHADLPRAVAPVALFVGIANYPPNRDAINWLTSHIWPMVLRDIPDARLKIVGDGSRELGMNSMGGSVECCGFVSNLDEAYQAARIALCPIWQGSGTRIKIIEAAMYGRAVVSTTIGAEGLAFLPGTEIVIADTASEFARACNRLLKDPEMAATIGRRAKARAEKIYSPDRSIAAVTLLCNKLLSRR